MKQRQAAGGASRDVERETAEQIWRVNLTEVNVPQKDEIILQASCLQGGHFKRLQQLLVAQRVCHNVVGSRRQPHEELMLHTFQTLHMSLSRAAPDDTPVLQNGPDVREVLQ